MRSIDEIVADIKSVLNEIERTQECDGEDTVKIDEFLNEILASNFMTQKGCSWIPCSERMPEVETEVLILAKRKYRGGGHKYIVTTALYEDGTVRENDSRWQWYDIDGEWDEEEDCLIIPEGWWEYRHFNADEVYNNEVDCEVIGWQPLPEKPEEEQP